MGLNGAGPSFKASNKVRLFNRVAADMEGSGEFDIRDIFYDFLEKVLRFFGEFLRNLEEIGVE